MSWQKANWIESQYPEREKDYITYDVLVDKDEDWLASIEQFIANDGCFYANTANARSGCMGTYELDKA